MLTDSEDPEEEESVAMFLICLHRTTTIHALLIRRLISCKTLLSLTRPSFLIFSAQIRTEAVFRCPASGLVPLPPTGTSMMMRMERIKKAARDTLAADPFNMKQPQDQETSDVTEEVCGFLHPQTAFNDNDKYEIAWQQEDQVDKMSKRLQKLAHARRPDKIGNFTSDPGASSALQRASALPNGGPQISGASVGLSRGFTKSLEEARNGRHDGAAKAPILHLSSLCTSTRQQEVETENWEGERGPSLYGIYRPEGSKTLVECNAAVRAGATPKPFSPKQKEEARLWNSRSQGPMKLFGSAKFIAECRGYYKQVDLLLVKIRMPMKPRLWLGSQLYNAINAQISDQAVDLQHRGPEPDVSLPSQPVDAGLLVQPHGTVPHVAPQPYLGFGGLSQQAHEQRQDMSVNKTAQPDVLDMMGCDPSLYGAIIPPPFAAYPFSGPSQLQPCTLTAPGQALKPAWGTGQTTCVAPEMCPGKQGSFRAPDATMMLGAAQCGGSHGYSSLPVLQDVLLPAQHASNPFAFLPPRTNCYPQVAPIMPSSATADLGGGGGGNATAALLPAGRGLGLAGTTVATREDQNHQHHRADMSGASAPPHMQVQEQLQLDDTAFSDWLADSYDFQ